MAVSSRSALLTTAFVNPDGRLAVVVMNTGDVALRYQLQDGPRQIELEIPRHAIQTLVEQRAR
jgi:glucosylceramidase